jgi:hypothetical protein
MARAPQLSRDASSGMPARTIRSTLLQGRQVGDGGVGGRAFIGSTRLVRLEVVRTFRGPRTDRSDHYSRDEHHRHDDRGGHCPVASRHTSEYAPGVRASHVSREIRRTSGGVRGLSFVARGDQGLGVKVYANPKPRWSITRQRPSKSLSSRSSTGPGFAETQSEAERAPCI